MSPPLSPRAQSVSFDCSSKSADPRTNLAQRSPNHAAAKVGKHAQGRWLGTEILSDQGGRYWLGTQGERTYGRANFRELYAVTHAGRCWELLNVDWRRGTCNVRPAPEGRAPRWSGGGRYLSEAIRKFRDQNLPTEVDALRWVGAAARQRVSEFEACLPTDLLERLQARNSFDVEGSRKAVLTFCTRVESGVRDA